MALRTTIPARLLAVCGGDREAAEDAISAAYIRARNAGRNDDDGLGRALSVALSAQRRKRKRGEVGAWVAGVGGDIPLEAVAGRAYCTDPWEGVDTVMQIERVGMALDAKCWSFVCLRAMGHSWRDLRVLNYDERRVMRYVQDLGARLAAGAWRNRRGLTAAQVGERIGCSGHVVADYESGTGRMRKAVRDRLAALVEL